MSAFDALAAAHRLEDAGMARQQAEAVIETARDAAGDPATKADLAATAADLKMEMVELKAELRTEILKWTIGAGGVYAGLVVAAVKLIPGP